ncbi:MAG: TonB-dependent receptor [Aureispira sp.]|nr:TonB-dependent receptor [Aureispira sp.]
MSKFIQKLFTLSLLLIISVGISYAQHHPTKGEGNGKKGGKGERWKHMPKIGKVIGTVIDSISNKPLEFATISVSRMKDSSMVGGAITNPKGKFEITELPVGRLIVKVSYMGYKSRVVGRIMVRPDNPLHDLGKVILAPTQAVLETAEVTAEKQIFQLGLDKKIFNVDKTELGQSENATEVLRNVPTVDVDMDGNVKIRGSAVQVYINGKPTGLTGESQAEIMDQLPANTIKSVELITNPSAKYDPEGESGIINVVLKKNVLEGFTGSVNGSVGTMFNKFDAGLALNYRNNKINVFSNFSYKYNDRWGKDFMYRKNMLIDTTIIDQESNSNRIRNGFFGRIGMDWYLDDYNTLTAAARVQPRGGGKTNTTEYKYLNSLETLMSSEKRYTDGNQKGLNMTYNLIYAHTFKKKEKKTDSQNNERLKGGHKGRWHGHHGHGGGKNGGFGSMGNTQELVVDMQYTNSDRTHLEEFYQELFDNTGNLIDARLDSQFTNTGTNQHNGTLKIDYTHPITPNHKLETGYKGTLRSIRKGIASESLDSLGQMTSDLDINNDFQFGEQIHAVYGTFAQKINKFSYKLGIRLEYTLSNSKLFTTNSTFTNNYFSYFPSVHLSYELPKNQQLQLGFSRRIRRPSIWALNPFAQYSDPLNLRVGNPFLMPQYSNGTELTYANYFKMNTIMISAFYRYNTDLMERVKTVDEEGVATSSYANFNNSHVYGGELVLRFQPYKWWNFGGSVSVYQQFQDGTNIDKDFKVNAVTGNASINSNFQFKFGMRIYLMGHFSLPSRLAQGRSNGYFWTSVSISQRLLKNKMNITLSVQNPIPGRYVYETSATNFIQNGIHMWESPIAYLKLSYRFGKVNVRDNRKSRASRLKGGGGDGEEGGMGR